MTQLRNITAIVESTNNSSMPVDTTARIEEFDHVTFWVGNAKQSALFYVNLFGFNPYAFRGLENGSRDYACHVVKINQAILQFVSAVEPDNKEHSDFLRSHGDAVKDVAFRVENIEQVLMNALKEGAELVKPISQVEIKDAKASVEGHKAYLKQATIKAFGDVTHTFIERNFEYKNGVFLPGYQGPSIKASFYAKDAPIDHVLRADHVVGQFPPNKLDSVTDWYCRVMKFNRFWSVDEKQIYTEHSGVISHVMANHNEKIMMPLCEVILSKKSKSKAEEFVRYNNGPGIHHIALLTDDIVATTHNMRARGMDFLNTPDIYYEQLKERLKDCSLEIHQDLETLRKLKILVDFDEKGYLLQIFTRPIHDRPTIVFEFIQRFNHNGFGAGNFLALFKAIEAETALRGNL